METNQELIVCDCCQRTFKKKETQKHHLVPKRLRDCPEDLLVLIVILCPNCHHSFHKSIERDWQDVSLRNKEYFINSYKSYKKAYKKEKLLFKKYLRSRNGKNDYQHKKNTGGVHSRKRSNKKLLHKKRKVRPVQKKRLSSR